MESLKTLVVQKKFLIVLFLGLISGTLFANFFGVKHGGNWGVFDANYMSNYSTMTFNTATLWGYIVRNRIRDIALLCILGMTAISTSAIMIYLFYIGTVIGLVISMVSMQYGIFGIWIYVVSIFPQYIFYALAICILIVSVNKKKLSVGKSKGYEIIMTILIPILLVLAGTCTEAFINPGFMKDMILNTYY